MQLPVKTFVAALHLVGPTHANQVEHRLVFTDRRDQRRVDLVFMAEDHGLAVLERDLG